MYDDECEYCDGRVESKLVDKEVFKHKSGFVMLEDVTIGICSSCGNRYYSAEILHRVHQIASGAVQPEKMIQIPSAHAA